MEKQVFGVGQIGLGPGGTAIITQLEDAVGAASQKQFLYSR